MDGSHKPAREPVLQPACERRTLPIQFEAVRDSGAGDGQFIIRGHAAVFNKWSLDLGGFREKIMPGFFDKVLSEDPDVHFFWDHDSRWTLARTRNKTLELRCDPAGLHEWARVAPTSYAADLRILMERRDIDQQSFAFNVGPDGAEWRIFEEDGREIVERILLPDGCSGLYDVTVTAQGAYPQTDASVVAHTRSMIRRAINEGYLPKEAAEVIVAPDDPAGTSESQHELDSGEERDLAPTVEDDSSREDAGEKTRVSADDRAKVLDEMAEAVAVERDRAREFERRKYQLTTRKE